MCYSSYNAAALKILPSTCERKLDMGLLCFKIEHYAFELCFEENAHYSNFSQCT